jgi:hypothetical protein
MFVEKHAIHPGAGARRSGRGVPSPFEAWTPHISSEISPDNNGFDTPHFICSCRRVITADERGDELEQRIKRIIEEGERTGPPDELEEGAYRSFQNHHAPTKYAVHIGSVMRDSFVVRVSE